MKKNRTRGSGQLSFWKKCFRLMKLTFLFMMMGLMQISASVYSQTARLTLDMRNARVIDVLEQIEKQSEFRFAYSAALIDLERKVTVSINEKNIDETLDALFAGTGVKHVTRDRHILLYPESMNPETETVVSHANGLQQRTVSGTVTDESELPLPGVTVLIKGTTQGTVTNNDGNYSLSNIPEDATLVFSFVGMKIQEIPVGNQTIINVIMEIDAIGIEEVVAIGYGTQTKRDISSSITNVSEKDFNKGITRNAIDLLQGKVAGLNITQGSGDITSEQTIRLRGISSLTGSSEPFFVIDGIPGSNINSLAPQDIESISVLKDVSATAIYGSRAASGVIVITTKKGAKNKSTVEYEGYITLSNVSNIPRLLNAEEWRNYTSANNIDTKGIDLGADTNWFEEIMRTGISHNHNLAASGANENSTYRVSFSALDQQGVVLDNTMKRYNARFMFNQKTLNDKLNLTFIGNITQRNFTPSEPNNFVLAYNMIPVVPVKNEDGTWFDSREFDQGNPVRNITLNERLHKNSLYYGNIRAAFTITKGLTTDLSLLKHRESDDYGEFNDSQTERGRNDLGYAKREYWTADKDLLEWSFNFKKSFTKKHNINILGGYSYEYNYYQNAGAQNRKFVTNFTGYNNLGSGENLRPDDLWSSANMSKLVSFFGRFNYKYHEKYIITGTVRRDGSSKFGKNHKWGTFPAFSAAWILSEEELLNDKRFLELLKLRIGYGISGNQAGVEPYQSLLLYGASGQYYHNENWLTAYSYIQNANPDLKWEETAMFNIGIDFSVFNGRLNGSIDYYDKNTKDLLYTYDVPIPPYFIPTMLANVGSMSNKGIETAINFHVIQKNNFNWNISMNLAHNKNKITSLSNEAFQTESVKTGYSFIRGGSVNTTSILEKGKPVGTFFTWKNLGIDESGLYILDDMIDGKPGLTNEDRTYVGSAQPDLTYGFTNSFSFKNWDFNFFMRGVYGNDVFNFGKLAYATTQWLPGANVLKDALTIGLNENPKINSYYIEKGSFLRMDNATIAYNFKTNRTLLGIQKLQIYITGQNLFTFTNYDGIDPEVDMSGLSPGVEGRSYYPKSRIYSTGIKLEF